jgi:hypothetical protein
LKQAQILEAQAEVIHLVTASILSVSFSTPSLHRSLACTESA